MGIFKAFLITAILSYELLWPAPATSLYECESGAIGYVLVSDYQGDPVFWLGRATANDVKYEDIQCMLPGNVKVLVLGEERPL